MKRCLLKFFVPLAVAAMIAGCAQPTPEYDADVIIVGAGLAGLSAAIEAASGGAKVVVVDMNSVFGGHGIQSGGVAIVGSPMQEAMGIEDSPDQAYRDWMAYTEDGHQGWTRFYVENSRTQIYDWITGMGVRFDRVIPKHGNSVERFHMTYRRGLNLVRPLYREALRYSNISFRWSLNVIRLTKDDGRVTGIVAEAWREGGEVELRAPAVILATGGFQSNNTMVKANWQSDLPVPPRFYSMSGQYSRGSGHRMAAEAGAALVHLERQYNGYKALPNPLHPEDTGRGLSGGNSRSIWVNAEGRRFVTETGFDREVYPAVVRQTGSTYWAIFDQQGKAWFGVSGPDWVSAEGRDRDKIERLILGNPDLAQSAETLDALAEKIDVPAQALAQTVAEYNARVEAGESTEVDGMRAEDTPPVFTITAAPFYAVRFYPLGIKSAGGISIDMSARALDAGGTAVPGLYAAGEVTGSAGINGLHGLDGTFTGPAILIGRVAGRTLVADLAAGGGWSQAAYIRDDSLSAESSAPANAGEWSPELGPDDLAPMVTEFRDGYWHFVKSHRLVLEREYACTRCHSAQVPFGPVAGKASKMAQAEVCDSCHLAPERR